MFHYLKVKAQLKKMFPFITFEDSLTGFNTHVGHDWFYGYYNADYHFSEVRRYAGRMLLTKGLGLAEHYRKTVCVDLGGFEEENISMLLHEVGHLTSHQELDDTSLCEINAWKKALHLNLLLDIGLDIKKLGRASLFSYQHGNPLSLGMYLKFGWDEADFTFTMPTFDIPKFVEYDKDYENYYEDKEAFWSPKVAA